MGNDNFTPITEKAWWGNSIAVNDVKTLVDGKFESNNSCPRSGGSAQAQTLILAPPETSTSQVSRFEVLTVLGRVLVVT